MAHAERLATQVKTMSARIKELEAALTNAQQPPLPPGKEPDSQLELQDSELTGDKYERDLDSVSKNLGSLAIDVETRRPRIANVTGGLSGPAIKPIAVRMVHEVSKAVKIPVVGMGGILRAEDAVEFMMAGATAVQVGTASYADPRAVENIANGLKRWCVAHDVAEVSSLTGSVLL